MKPRKRGWARAAILAAGLAGLAMVVLSVGPGRLLRGLAAAWWVLPGLLLIHLGQLFLSSLAWRELLGLRGTARWTVFVARWVREGVNALLPTAQIGGQVAGVMLLVRRGVRPPRATAGLILDLTVEAVAQFAVTLAALLVLLAGRGLGHGWALVAGGVATSGAIAFGLVAAQRLRVGRWIERSLERAALRWPMLEAWSLAGLHDVLAGRLQDRRALARAFVLQAVAWSVGAAEAWLVLWALGHRTSAAGAFVIEALGMAARSAGFVVPGAIGVQEGGFVLVCALYGVPAGAALTLSVLKRVREVAVGLPALWLWQNENHHAAYAAAKH